MSDYALRLPVIVAFMIIIASAPVQIAFSQHVSITPLEQREHVRDRLGLFDTEGLQLIKRSRDKLMSEHGTRLVVATLESVEEYADKSIPVEYFATLLFEEWFEAPDEASISDVPKGILFIVMGVEGRVYIETDPTWHRKGFLHGVDIVKSVVAPQFEKGTYAEGVVAGIETFAEAIPTFEESSAREIPWTGLLVGLAMTVCIGILIAYFVLRTSEGISLHDAAREGDWGLLEKTLKRGKVSADGKDVSNATPLYYAAKSGHMKCVEVLLKYGAAPATERRVRDSPLAQAIISHNLPIVEVLMNRSSSTTQRFDDDLTPLMLAAQKGEFEILRFLYYRDKDTEQIDKRGKTPLFYAVESSYEHVVDFLLSRGADVGHFSRAMRTPLMHAVDLKHHSIVGHLLDAGADVDAETSKGLNSLMIAVQQGEIDLVKTLIKAGAKVNAATWKGVTSLMLAADEGDIDVVRLLLKAGADPIIDIDADLYELDPYLEHVKNERLSEVSQGDAKSERCSAVTELIMDRIRTEDIHRAVRAGRVEIVQRIVQRAPNSVDLNEENTGATPLELAIEGGREEIVRMLLKDAADLMTRTSSGLTPLMLAVIEDDKSIAEQLLSAGVDVSETIEARALPDVVLRKLKLDVDMRLTAEDIAIAMHRPRVGFLFKVQETALKAYEKLISAVSGGDLAEAARIVQSNPAVMSCNRASHELAPLVIAIQNHDIDALKFLLRNGDDPDQRNSTGKLPINFAISQSSDVIVDVLLESGGDCEKVYKGMSPLMEAAMISSHKVVDSLVSHGAEVNRQSEMGNTALSIAIERGDVDILRALIRHNADLSLRSKDRTPLDRAALNGDPQVVAVLIENGADVNGTSKSKKTAAHHAAGGGHVEVLKILIENGADLNVRYRGQTPLDRAVKMGHEKAVELLRKEGLD